MTGILVVLAMTSLKGLCYGCVFENEFRVQPGSDPKRPGSPVGT